MLCLNVKNTNGNTCLHVFNKSLLIVLFPAALLMLFTLSSGVLSSVFFCRPCKINGVEDFLRQCSAISICPFQIFEIERLKSCPDI